MNFWGSIDFRQRDKEKFRRRENEGDSHSHGRNLILMLDAALALQKRPEKPIFLIFSSVEIMTWLVSGRSILTELNNNRQMNRCSSCLFIFWLGSFVNSPFPGPTVKERTKIKNPKPVAYLCILEDGREQSSNHDDLRCLQWEFHLVRALHWCFQF